MNTDNFGGPSNNGGKMMLILDDDYIKLKVINPYATETEIHFRVKGNTRMEKLKNSYADRIGLPVSALRFLFKGRFLNDDDTPQLLQQVEGDVINISYYQYGGY